MKNPQLPALTSLRFFAAAAIVMEHSIPYFHIGESFAAKYVLIQGVTFFFVLSGFILTYSQKAMSGVGDSMRFVYSRICRVWPAHIIAMMLFYVVFVHGFGIAYEPSLWQTALSATLTQAWSPLPTDFFAFNGVAWTLSVEMFFYALFPILVANFSNTWHIKLALSGALAAYAILLAMKTGAKPFVGENIPSIASWVYIWPPAHLIEFVLGMIAGHLWKTCGQQLADGKRFSGKGVSTGAEVIGVLLILVGSVKMPELGWRLEGAGHIGEAARTWISVSGSAPFYAVGLLLLARGEGYIGRVLSLWPLMKLGEISFSMYLMHQLIERALQLHPHLLDAYPMGLQFAAYWIVTIAASAALWFVAEERLTRWMKAIVIPPRKSSAFGAST